MIRILSADPKEESRFIDAWEWHAVEECKEQLYSETHFGLACVGRVSSNKIPFIYLLRDTTTVSLTFNLEKYQGYRKDLAAILNPVSKPVIFRLWQ